VRVECPYEDRTPLPSWPESSASCFVCSSVRCRGHQRWQAQVAGPSLVYAQKVPDDASTTVGPGYTGLDPAMIVSALEATDITEPKSVYETSADYQKRRATLPIHGNLSGLPPDGRLAFVLNGPAARGGSTLGGVELSYDADKQLMSVKIDIAKSDFRAQCHIPSLQFSKYGIA